MKALELTQLHKTYANGHQALKGIDLSVDEGDFFALLGPNGAGKSSCIGIVASLVNKTSGTVKVFGHDLDTQLLAVKNSIGLVPQEFNFNIFEPVVEIVINQAGYYGVPRLQAERRAEQVLKQLGLWEKRNQQARDLSGGMKRRLMIARALIHEPRLLILDEPTAGVDIELRRSMWSFLQQINEQGTTIILTTHYLEEAEQLCKNIAIIDRGDIVENTSMRELLNRLDCETFVFYCKAPYGDLPELEDIQFQPQDELSFEALIWNSQPINRVFEALSAEGVEIVSMRNKVNRLEEMFVNLISSPENAA